MPTLSIEVRRKGAVATASTLFLVLLLTSISHRVSPGTSTEPLPSGSTPRPSRRAPPSQVSVCRPASAERRDREYPRDRACQGAILKCVAPAMAPDDPLSLPPQVSQPDYLNLFRRSNPHNYLSPPA
jgi:hypothetical protein